MSGALPADGLANETLHEALDLCLQCKACKTECPSNVDMAKLKAEFLHQYYQGRPVPLGSLLMGHIHRLNPIGAAIAPLANWTLRQPVVQVAPGEGRPGSTAAGPCRRSTPTTSASGSAGTGPTPAPGRAGRSLLLDDCFTTYNTPEVGRAAVRVLEAAGYRVELAGLPCCGRPAISKGLLTLGRDLARANVARLVGHARAGHADRRLRAELPADAGRRVPRLPARPRRRPRRRRRAMLVDAFVGRPRRASPTLRLEALRGPRPAPRPLPAEGAGGHVGDGRGAAAGPGPGGQGARLGLLRDGRLVRLRARPLRRERRPGPPRAPARPSPPTPRPAWSRRASPAGARSTAWPGSRPCTRSSCWPNSLPERSPPPTARIIRFGRGGKASRDCSNVTGGPGCPILAATGSVLERRGKVAESAH